MKPTSNSNKKSNDPNYRAISLTTRSAPDVVYRSLNVAIPSAAEIKPASYFERENAVKGATSTPSSSKLLVANPATTTTATKTALTPEIEVFSLRELSSVYPLNENHFFIKEGAVTSLVDCLTLSLGEFGEVVVKSAKGVVRVKGSSGCSIKVCFFKTSQAGRVCIEFNRMTGCPYMFQKGYLKSLLQASKSCQMESLDQTTIEAQLKSLEQRYNRFPSRMPVASATSSSSTTTSSVMVQ